MKCVLAESECGLYADSEFIAAERANGVLGEKIADSLSQNFVEDGRDTFSDLIMAPSRIALHVWWHFVFGEDV